MTSIRATIEQRLTDMKLAAFDLYAIYLGHHLGLYGALAESEPITSVELAGLANCNERYVREWLEQQAVSGLIVVQGESLDAKSRRYSIEPGSIQFLVDQSHPSSVIPSIRSIVSCGLALPLLLDAYRTGAGLPFSAYGTDMLDGQEWANRNAFDNDLGQRWLPSIPEVHARLSSDPPARVADLGFGAGWSSIAIAKAYPKVEVDGLELDEASVMRARMNAKTAGLGERVRFHLRDAADPALAGQYDLACIFEALHDMAQPVHVLSAMRVLVAPHGFVLIVDERVADEFTAPGDENERMNYGYSITHCLPVGMQGEHPVGTGAVFRRPMMRRYAADAGFSRVRDVFVEHESLRCYLLQP